MLREEKPSTVSEMQKSQALRLWDVFFLGPFLIYAATRERLSPEAKTLLIASGLLTIVYNARNYQANRSKTL